MELSEISNKVELLAAIDEFIKTPRIPKLRGEELNVILKKVIDIMIKDQEPIVVAAGASIPYVITWDSTKIAKYGAFVNFLVWIDNGAGGYDLQPIPVTMTPNVGETAAADYQFNLSGFKSFIFII